MPSMMRSNGPRHLRRSLSPAARRSCVAASLVRHARRLNSATQRSTNFTIASRACAPRYMAVGPAVLLAWIAGCGNRTRQQRLRRWRMRLSRLCRGSSVNMRPGNGLLATEKLVWQSETALCSIPILDGLSRGSGCRKRSAGKTGWESPSATPASRELQADTHTTLRETQRRVCESAAVSPAQARCHSVWSFLLPVK